MNWTIIGCGWLGTSLAEILLENGHTVFGTTTSIDKQKVLEKKGIKSSVFKLNSQISTEIIGFSDIVVLSIPPFNKENPSDYGNALSSLVQQFNSKTKFIFLSSTGVYPQKSGIYTEDYAFNLGEKNSSLYQAEKKLSEYLNEHLTILRLGGLFGEDRHPIYHLAGRVDVKNPLGKINFVGKNDIISIIQILVKKDKLGDVYNVIFPEYPTRQIYYSEKAKTLNLIPPIFENSSSIIREIDSKKIQKTLDFKFQHAI